MSKRQWKVHIPALYLSVFLFLFPFYISSLLIPPSTYAFNTQYNADRKTSFAWTTSDLSPNTGVVIITQTDLSLPGRAGLDPKLTLIYTSSTANLYGNWRWVHVLT